MSRLRSLLIGVLLCTVLAGVPRPADAAVTFFWSAEDNTLAAFDGDPDFSAGDGTATANASVTIDAAAALVGSSGVLVDAAGEYFHFANASIISPTEGSVGFWFRPQTWNANGSLFQSRGANANDYIKINGTATDELILNIRHNTSGVATISTTAVNITNNTTYFVTFSWDDTGNRRRLCVYNSSGTLIEACTTSAAAYTGPADLTHASGLRFGDVEGVAIAFYLDNMFVGSSYDDADCFLTNRNITTYTAYATCGGGGVPAGTLMLLGVGK